MEYNATIKVGIDVEAIKVDIKNDKVIVSVPHTKLLDTPHVDPSSIKYVDEKKAIFNWTTKPRHRRRIRSRLQQSLIGARVCCPKRRFLRCGAP